MSSRASIADSAASKCHRFEVTDFIARLVAHIPDKGQMLQRDYGYYANRARQATQGSPGARG